MLRPRSLRPLVVVVVVAFALLPNPSYAWSVPSHTRSAYSSSSSKIKHKLKHNKKHSDKKGGTTDWHAAIRNDSPRRVWLQQQALRIVAMTTAATATAALSSAPTTATALTPDQAAVQYNQFAANYNALDGGPIAQSQILPLAQARQELLQWATGRVLEMGVGTGLNLPYYNANTNSIASLTLIDISPGMLAQAQQTAAGLASLQRIPVHTAVVDATSREAMQALIRQSPPQSSSSESSSSLLLFDTVVDTFSFCVLGTEARVRQCLQQLIHVLQPHTGRLLLLENTLSTNPWLARYQDATASAAAQLGGKGCVYNQDIKRILETTAELEILHETIYAAGIFRAYVCRRVVVERGSSSG